MPDQFARAFSRGLQKGAKLTIEMIYSDGVQEWVTILNQGTVAQPMNGWILARLPNKRCFEFPKNLVILPGMNVKVLSGGQKNKGGRDGTNSDLFWTSECVWNNHGDMAVLFHIDGAMAAYCIY